MVRFLVSLVLAVLVGCASVPNTADLAARPGQGAIGIEVGIRPPLPIVTYTAEQVYFARVGERGEPELDTLYATSVFKDGRAYALNIPPGRYFAVAGAFKVMGDTYISYFPRSMIVETNSLASDGKVAFAGRYLLDSAIGVCPDKADELQLRIAETMSPGTPKCGLLRMAIHDTFKQGFVVIRGAVIALGPWTFQYGGIVRETHRDAEAERAFRRGATKDLLGSGWEVSNAP